MPQRHHTHARSAANASVTCIEAIGHQRWLALQMQTTAMKGQTSVRGLRAPVGCSVQRLAMQVRTRALPSVAQTRSEQKCPAAVQLGADANAISSTWIESRMDADLPPWPTSDPHWCVVTACSSRWLLKRPLEHQQTRQQQQPTARAEPPRQVARHANPPPPPVPPEPPPQVQVMCIRLPVCSAHIRR